MSNLLVTVTAAGFLFTVSDLAGQETSTDRSLRLAADGVSLTVRPQTAAEAYGFLENVLGQMDFFRENQYDVALPDHSDFDETGELGSFEAFQAAVYRPAQFGAAMDVMDQGTPLLRSAVAWFAAHRGMDGFRVFDDYLVTITLYGPGGTYDPATGSIVLLADERGAFKGGGGPHTIVHEMMHLAVEDGFVQQYGLTHWEKERLVDLLTQQAFADLLPDYRLQSQGVDALDPYVSGVPLAELADSVAAYAASR